MKYIPVQTSLDYNTKTWTCSQQGNRIKVLKTFVTESVSFVPVDRNYKLIYNQVTFSLKYLITAGGLLSHPQPGPDWSLVGRLSLQDSTGKDPHHATRGSH